MRTSYMQCGPAVPDQPVLLSVFVCFIHLQSAEVMSVNLTSGMGCEGCEGCTHFQSHFPLYCQVNATDTKIGYCDFSVVNVTM